MNVEVWDGQPLTIGRYVYDGIFYFDPVLPPDIVSKAHALAESVGWLEVSFLYASVDYDGEDKGRFMLSALIELAAIVGQSKTQMHCFVYPVDEGWEDRIFVEFLSIRNGRLLKQHAEVIRKDEPEPVANEDLVGIYHQKGQS